MALTRVRFSASRDTPCDSHRIARFPRPGVEIAAIALAARRFVFRIFAGEVNPGLGLVSRTSLQRDFRDPEPYTLRSGGRRIAWSLPTAFDPEYVARRSGFYHLGVQPLLGHSRDSGGQS
jgi:hypothetical protein